uniref:Transcription factor TFIIB cyclin-like domain-containing protein n=1 Tax=viral metagenome TaxID=1070528 RepID=A0A6C0DRF8_9ZZZZ
MADLLPGVGHRLTDEDRRMLDYLRLELDPCDTEEAVDLSSWWCDGCETDEHIHVETETVICRRCGEIFENILDQGPEYRWFTGDDRNPDPTRVGAPQNPLLPESSLGTTMLLRKNHGNVMRKIKRYHTWNLMPYRERNLWGIFEGLHVRAINAGIGIGVLEEAKRLYAQLSALCVCRGTQKEALLAACLYESLKRSGTPRRPKDIATIFQINLRHVTKGLKQFANLLNMDERMGTRVVAAENRHNTNTMPAAAGGAAAPVVNIESRRAKWDSISRSTTTFEHYIEPFVSKLEAPRNFTGTLVMMTRQICTRADDMGICPENTPPSLTAAALALACSALTIQKSIQEIAAVCDISVVTLHKCLKRLEVWRQNLLETK